MDLGFSHHFKKSLYFKQNKQVFSQQVLNYVSKRKKKKKKFDKIYKAPIPGFSISGKEWFLFLFITILSGD